MSELKVLANITHGVILADNYSGGILHYLTDSRKLINPANTIFIAIQGARHDGHDYIRTLFHKGVRYFMVEKNNSVTEELKKYAGVILVKDSLGALQKIASIHRQSFHYPVVGITGSNGKTIVKEWLGQLLTGTYRIVKSPASYNSQLGVPLSVLQMTEHHTLGVFEAGISTVGEMEKLQKVIQPTLGIFTNIGTSHDEGFVSKTEKVQEKWKLFGKGTTVIYCADHQAIQESKPPEIVGFTWGRSGNAEVMIESIEARTGATVITLKYREKTMEIAVPFQDDASIENIMHCISLMLYLGIDTTALANSVQRISTIEMRLSLKKGINNCYLIDDSYNNDLGGLQVAIDFLHRQPGSKKKIILSDILQSGQNEVELYGQLAMMIRENSIDSIIGIGEAMIRQKALFPIKAEFFHTTEDFLQYYDTERFRDETILIKGARSFGFERITNALSAKLHRTILEINLNALNDNLNFYRRKIKSGVKLMVMVKASAYGSGSLEVANLLQFNRVDYLTVAYPDEGVELRRQGIHIPMMVMNAVPESFEKIIDHQLEPEIFSLNQLQALLRFLANKSVVVGIHLKLDSGMHRLGFEKQDIPELIRLLENNPQFQVKSIYSHLAGADEPSLDYFTHEQVARFNAMADEVEGGLGYSPLRHILNSAGIYRFPQYQFSMVRLGIGLYGFEANRIAQNELRPISTLKTIVSQVREVKAGETIGYSRKGKISRDSKIATIAIGYADGFSRAFGNGKISLFIHGKPAPVIGNVCMDMTMLDVTGMDVHEGDEVIVFGDSPSIIDLATAIGTIPYEILTSISSRVSRVFYSG